MKILIDANISWRLIRHLNSVFPEVQHVNFTELPQPAKDITIWQYALQNNYTILTSDEDFQDFISYKGFPPKVILLRIGNIKTDDLAKIILNHHQDIIDFITALDIGILEIY
jgi:predicted nuclease of predicted toxin-antitoxin system